MRNVSRGPDPAEYNAAPVASRPWQTLRFADHLVPPMQPINDFTVYLPPTRLEPE